MRRHHAAHQPGAACAAAHPETALHLNVKFFLADALQRAAAGTDTLRIRRRCLVGNRSYETAGESTWSESVSPSCAEVDDVAWIDRWDEVRVEERVAGAAGHRKPDIVLMRQGKPVGAIEVFVSHSVDPDKVAMLAALNVPWIELRATESLYDPETGWTIGQPLEPMRGSMAVAWRCASHRLSYAAETAKALAVAERPADRPVLMAARLVDLYRRGGTAHRVVYRVRASYANGVIVRLTLDRDRERVASYPVARGEAQASALARVRSLVQRDYDADLRTLARRAQIVDAGRWLRADAARALDEPSHVRPRYRFDPRKHEWTLRITRETRLDALDRIETAVRGRRAVVHQRLTRSDE